LATSWTISVSPESDSMMSCNFSFISAGLLYSLSMQPGPPRRGAA
jgi:hypothetical protein